MADQEDRVFKCQNEKGDIIEFPVKDMSPEQVNTFNSICNMEIRKRSIEQQMNEIEILYKVYAEALLEKLGIGKDGKNKNSNTS